MVTPPAEKDSRCQNPQGLGWETTFLTHQPVPGRELSRLCLAGLQTKAAPYLMCLLTQAEAPEIRLPCSALRPNTQKMPQAPHLRDSACVCAWQLEVSGPSFMTLP